MKAWKKILIYLAFIIGILLALVLICFAVMYFSPGTSILGYEYILYNKKVTNEYTISSIPSISGIQAVEIITEESDIYIYPNTQENVLKVYHNQGLSGFVKSVNADLNMDISIQTKSFEESLVSYKTFCLNLNEPNGWVAKSNAAVYVYLPNNISPSTVYARSNSGNIYYVSENIEEIEVEGQKQTKTHTLNCTNLYMKTGNYGKLSIDNKHNISNYYLKTSRGKVSFYDVTAISANTVKFETDSGLFDLRNANGDAKLTLSNKLEIRSYGDYAGPSVYINKLVGDLYVDADNGLYNIGTVGSYGVYKKVAMTINSSKINIGTVYGEVSILGQGNNISNEIYVGNHYYDPEHISITSVYENGSAPVTIENLDAHASFDSTSGSINIKTATNKSNIYAYSNSGSISVKYVSSEEDHPETKLTILTKTGNVNLNNVSCLFEVHVLENSSSSSLNIVLDAVAYKQESGVVYDNIINAKNRKVNLTLEGVSDNLQFRIVSTNEVKIAEGTVGQNISYKYDADGVVNNDYLLETPGYEDFGYCYRIGYNKGNENYNSNAFDKWGKLLITTSNNTYVNSRGL
ncbi:MAG: DUF4097 family beta strand repeat protein [Clostridia bacterium]|nr:DUF4097 family beta strand repeat protein [Clostridia bacterium]